jgi:hypothetical protein
MNEINLTTVEKKVLSFLVSRNEGTVYWEEMVQFAKDPQKTSRKTALKWVSEIRRKYCIVNAPLPFNVTFSSLADKKSEYVEPVTEQIVTQILIDGQQQNLVKLKRNPNMNPTPVTHQAHTDFILDRNTRRVRTKDGIFQLNENEWNVFKYIHENVDKMIPLSELRDKVVFPNYGSKLPARWFDSIMRIVNNLRRQVIGLNNRLLTVKGAETTYLFK